LQAACLMRRPRQIRLSLICIPSKNRYRSTPISLRLSEPARSMNVILPIMLSPAQSVRSMKIEKIKWDRLDVSLTKVDRITLLSKPYL
jgi:hypothetical protein